jgi:predicted GNAT family acetyltransferase
VTLAINAKNEVAARVYEKIGFTKLGEFNTFERQV